MEERPMRKLMKTFGAVAIACTLVVGAAAGCKSKPKCEQAYDHVLSIAPAERKASIEKQKDRMLEKCAKDPAEKVDCFIAAKDWEAMNKCDEMGKEKPPAAP
jgi:hypothetical protein